MAEHASEFTGERIIPGMVNADLWNEHISRYHFASRLCRFKKVIDLGCGSGYGSAELARTADSVVGVDVDPTTISEAARNYRLPNLEFRTATVDQLPFENGYFHTGVCFEVIEHIENFRALLAEARRVINPHGQLVISTPNRLYYAESRRDAGPNPFHVREFTFEEFRTALAEFFPHQTFFVQNHTSGLVFLPLENKTGTEIKVERENTDPAAAHFFVAVCAAKPLLGAPSYVYIPQAANVLQQRETHIRRLEDELETKDQWLAQSKQDLAALVEQFRALNLELEAKNRWALEQNEKVLAAAAALHKLEGELADQHRRGAEVVAQYETRIQQLEEESASQLAWAKQLETDLLDEADSLKKHLTKLDIELQSAGTSLSQYQAKLDEAEATVIERTHWAQREQALREELEARLSSAQASRWVKIGRVIGLGPKLT